VPPENPIRTENRGLGTFPSASEIDSLSKFVAVNTIAVADQEARRLVEREGLDDLLRRPLRRRMGGNVEVYNMPPVVTQRIEREQNTECGRGNGEEVDGDDIANMVVQERPPRRRWRLARTDSVPVNRRLGDDVAQERELGLDARRSPKRVLARHSTNQLANLSFDPRASGFPLRLPSPKELEALAMPSNNGVRLDDEQDRTPTWPDPGQADPEQAVAVAELRALRGPLQNRQLLAKSEILGGEFRSVTKDARKNTTKMRITPISQPPKRSNTAWRR